MWPKKVTVREAVWAVMRVTLEAVASGCWGTWALWPAWRTGRGGHLERVPPLHSDSHPLQASYSHHTHTHQKSRKTDIHHFHTAHGFMYLQEQTKTHKLIAHIQATSVMQQKCKNPDRTNQERVKSIFLTSKLRERETNASQVLYLHCGPWCYKVLLCKRLIVTTIHLTGDQGLSLRAVK